MIGPAGTVGLYVTSTQREAAVGRGGGGWMCKHSAVLPLVECRVPTPSMHLVDTRS